MSPAAKARIPDTGGTATPTSRSNVIRTSTSRNPEIRGAGGAVQDPDLRAPDRSTLTILVGKRAAVELKPGSYHLMLIGLRRALTPGQTVTLTLQFERAGRLTTRAEVR